MAAMFPTPSADANVIRYRIFFRSPRVSPTPQPATKASAHDEDDGAFAEQRRAAYTAFLQRHTTDFIWHKHAMHLAATPATAITDSPLVRSACLTGETSVGDAIDDEWVVTWLLFQLSTAFPEDDPLIQVSDTDGEFLLIECADVLPDWVSPENSVNRVFVHRGVLHLVPLTVVAEFETQPPREELQLSMGTKRKSKKPVKQLTDEQRVLDQAIAAVWGNSDATRANAAMQRLLQEKISEAPQYMRTNRHRVRCLLPARAAYVCKRRPELIGAAVEAFYYREPQEAAAVCRRMTAFSPASSVSRVVTMSRCHYAQLKQQQFFAPPPFRHLDGVDGMASGDGGPETRAVEIGVKLACGLELLYASDDCDQFGVEWRCTIDEASVGFDPENEISRVEEDDVTAAVDDDAWLYVHPDTLEEKLQRVASRTTGASVEGADGDVGGAEELQNIATMFNNFLSGVSGVDGVEDAEPVSLDMSAFMGILNGQLRTPGVSSGSGFDVQEDDDEWDDPEDDDDDGDSDDGGDEDASSVDSDDEIDEDETQPEDEEDRIMREAMEEMDAELRGTTLSKTFTHAEPTSAEKEEEDGEHGGVDPDKPLDLDFHLLSNLLESMASQEGLAGPVSNILSELGSVRR